MRDSVSVLMDRICEVRSSSCATVHERAHHALIFLDQVGVTRLTGGGTLESLNDELGRLARLCYRPAAARSAAAAGSIRARHTAPLGSAPAAAAAAATEAAR